MTRTGQRGAIVHMLDPDYVLLCEHGCERDECALCDEGEPGEEAAEPDVSVWAEAHLAGVPFN